MTETVMLLQRMFFVYPCESPWLFLSAGVSTLRRAFFGIPGTVSLGTKGSVEEALLYSSLLSFPLCVTFPPLVLYNSFL